MHRAFARSFLAFCTLFVIRPELRAQEIPVNVPFCDLARSPKSFDGKIVRVRGTLSVFFEDFSLFSKDCDTQQGIWLAFGGDVPGIVPSTWNDMSRKPGENIKVNGISYGIKKDENFRRLYALIAARHGNKPLYRVTATLTGTFLAGEESKMPNGQTEYRGYGHLYCCSLLMITQVLDVKPVPSTSLRVRGTAVGPSGKPLKGLVVFDDVLGGFPPERQQATTNERGEFEFSDSGQLLRIENPDYRPVALTADSGGVPVKVKLEDSKKSDWLVPSCGEHKDSDGRVGFSIQLALPASMDSELSTDIEERRVLYIFPHGTGPAEANLIVSSSTDQVSDFLDSDASEIRERWIRDNSGRTIGIDVRARMGNGDHSRSATFYGRDGLTYLLPARNQTGALDAIIDSACIVKR